MPQCYQSIIVEAPTHIVWDFVKNFHDLSWANNFIETCEAVGNKSGTEVGAKRILNGAFHETLLECNEQEHRIRYSIDDGPSPVSPKEVSNYIGQILLKPITLNDATLVEWSSTWEAKTDEARDFCHLIYTVLLKALANKAENL
jgi:Polyketide cyclase / dehydrase and lipid transport